MSSDVVVYYLWSFLLFCVAVYMFAALEVLFIGMSVKGTPRLASTVIVSAIFLAIFIETNQLLAAKIILVVSVGLFMTEYFFGSAKRIPAYVYIILLVIGFFVIWLIMLINQRMSVEYYLGWLGALEAVIIFGMWLYAKLETIMERELDAITFPYIGPANTVEVIELDSLAPKFIASADAS